MLDHYFSQLFLLLKRLLLVYLAYFICRVLFYSFNHTLFGDIGFFERASIYFYALRFDTFSILVCNSLFIILSILPVTAFYSGAYQKILLWLYAITNTIFLLSNLIDIVYFPYIKKRSTADIFNQMGGQTDMSTLLPQYIKDFWYLLLIFIVLVFLLVRFYKKIKISPRSYTYNAKSLTYLILIFLLSASLTVLGIRGGFQKIPIDVVDAGQYTKTQYTSLVLNSPFTIIKSFEKKELALLDFGIADPETIFNPIHHYKNDTLQKLNIVVIIMESCAKEYTKLGKLKSYTPFLDSLMDHSLAFTNAFANGHKSIEGIPAILSSMPTLMEDPFINSTYADNFYPSFANILNAEGYTSAFFHGGTNGTMNFDSYAKQNGYSAYFGRTEYANDADFDGSWGIWDEPFLKFGVKKMNEMKQPFHSAIFTLSAHHPYKIPEKYKGKFAKGHLEIHESIGYADHAIRLFFQEAKKQMWYTKTLFVLVADHSSISDHPFYRNNVGQFAIPVLFFKPDNSLKRSYSKVFQQSDILPSVLDMIGYNKPFFSFGKSYKDTLGRYAVYYTDSRHHFLNDSLVIDLVNYKINNVINYRRDSILEKGLINSYPFETEKRYCEAYLQLYNKRLINNACTAK
ncbi:MAG: LTA synthase family protein [Sphingobacteriaceae bacterium]|nr:LTA synthase family protein [Sphingobacteriaceae bacterium]